MLEEICKKHTLWSQKTVAVILLIDGIALNFSACFCVMGGFLFLVLLDKPMFHPL
jgi:hypothetical protein